MESSEKGKPFIKTMHGQITLIIIGAGLSIFASFFIFNYQIYVNEKIESQNLAKAYLNDIEYVNNTLTKTEYEYNYISDTTLYPNRSPNWSYPIYPKWGLYHSNRQDISKFNPELSNDLYSFYYLLLIAETEREELNNWEKYHPGDVLFIQNIDGENAGIFGGGELNKRDTIYDDMINITQNSIKKIPELREKLLIESGSC